MSFGDYNYKKFRLEKANMRLKQNCEVTIDQYEKHINRTQEVVTQNTFSMQELHGKRRHYSFTYRLPSTTFCKLMLLLTSEVLLGVISAILHCSKQHAVIWQWEIFPFFNTGISTFCPLCSVLFTQSQSPCAMSPILKPSFLFF